jgi:hypothetical protein
LVTFEGGKRTTMLMAGLSRVGSPATLTTPAAPDKLSTRLS